MNRRIVAVVASATGLALTLTGCGSGSGKDAKSADEPYRVLVTGGLSAQGALADNSATSVLSAKAGAKVVNASGGILGHKVEVTVVDDASDPTTAVTKLREAINSGKKPDLFLDSGPSTVTAAVLPILKQSNILSMNIGPTADSSNPSAFPLNFDLAPSPTDYVKGFIPHLKEKGYKKVGIIHGSSSYGETFNTEVTKAFTGAGIKVVKSEEYDVAALDMTPQLQSVRAAGPDALIMDGYGAPVGYLLKSMKKLGWKIPIVANTSVSATGLISTPPPTGVLGTDQVKNLVMQVHKSTKHDSGDAAVNKAVAAMKSLGRIRSTLILANNYDALTLVAAAAEKTGSLGDPKALAKALEDKSVQAKAKTTMMNGYHFTATSHSPNSDAGAFLFVEPSEIKDGQFQ
ncbi:ABC transporter substrate-binding protein [Streptomyces antnestii]|uniref:ABC transporter substrate-binding protein n=1 Tax=Streptomyces antnestii TaxID=2494256 RepID=A0A3S2XY60_9ACTN|nr:ABC transporter substrate-binding protein [Streptomyces sp. San01]RVU28083.1 ABC transporter substrate-binding protein [Streptomyces sp. San01]